MFALSLRGLREVNGIVSLRIVSLGKIDGLRKRTRCVRHFLVCSRQNQNVNMLSIVSSVLRRFLQNASQKHVLFSSVLAFCLLSNAVGIGDVIWAVNCGGEAHTDIHGIRYQADPLEVGFASEYGKNLIIQRVVPQDQVLYQTERYHLSTFSYDIPIWKDGDYVLVMKFSEVWFTSPNQKVR